MQALRAPYEEVCRESDDGLGGTDSASCQVSLALGEPMLLLYAYDSFDDACVAGHVPARFCPMCGRDLRGRDD